MFLSIKRFAHRHEWGEWYKESKRSWLHYEQIARYCNECGETEYKLLFLLCSTKKRTGEYCWWCKPYIEEWEKRLDKVSFSSYNQNTLTDTSMARTFKAGSKDNKPLVKRNEALYQFVVTDGHTYDEAERKFNITRARCYQIIDRTRARLEKQPA